jgi:hypothetical protein
MVTGHQMKSMTAQEEVLRKITNYWPDSLIGGVGRSVARKYSPSSGE